MALCSRNILAFCTNIFNKSCCTRLNIIPFIYFNEITIEQNKNILLGETLTNLHSLMYYFPAQCEWMMLFKLRFVQACKTEGA
jgi:hypothetical protein